MLPTQCTLVYEAGSTTVAAGTLRTALEAVVLYASAGADPVLLGLYDCTVASDVGTVVGANAVRTIVLNLGAGFFALFPSAASWVGAFPDFYTHTLSQGVQASVEPIAPVFA